jgi:hypothetical protein
MTTTPSDALQEAASYIEKSIKRQLMWSVSGLAIVMGLSAISEHADLFDVEQGILALPTVLLGIALAATMRRRLQTHQAAYVELGRAADTAATRKTLEARHNLSVLRNRTHLRLSTIDSLIALTCTLPIVVVGARNGFLLVALCSLTEYLMWRRYQRLPRTPKHLPPPQ